MIVTIFLGILSCLSGYKAVSWKLYGLTHKQHDHIKLHFLGKPLKFKGFDFVQTSEGGVGTRVATSRQIMVGG